MTQAALIFNPAAGGGKRRRTLLRVAEILTAGGYQVELSPTSAPGDASGLAREAAAGGAGAVFAFGGDGTLRETAAGLLGTSVPLGFVPGGTANVMARALGLPLHPQRAAAALLEAPVREIDVGLCGGAPFLMQASVGIDAHVLAALATRAQRGLKRRLGRLGVGLGALPALWSYRFPEIELRADGRELRCAFAAVCNVSLYAGDWRLVADARLDDGRLDLLALTGRGRRAALGFARDLFVLRRRGRRGRHERRADVEVVPVQRVELLSPAPLPLQVDGDPLPAAPPIEVRLATERLSVFAPCLEPSSAAGGR